MGKLCGISHRGKYIFIEIYTPDPCLKAGAKEKNPIHHPCLKAGAMKKSLIHYPRLKPGAIENRGLRNPGVV
jgi:hypothetical protein